MILPYFVKHDFKRRRTCPNCKSTHFIISHKGDGELTCWEYQGKAVFAVATCRFYGCIPIVLAMQTSVFLYVVLLIVNVLIALRFIRVWVKSQTKSTLLKNKMQASPNRRFVFKEL